MSVNYNLLEEGWIPVLYKRGVVGHLGILDAFDQAAQIRQLALASPLDSFAVLRFMLTLLYWKAGLAGDAGQIRESLLRDGKTPDVVLGGIKEEARCFDLFADGSPFLQDVSLSATRRNEMKSAASFFAELASGTNIAHFHHGDDESLRLCIPCVALGLLRVVPWTQSGGAGLTPSVHNAPPIVALARGDSLAATLGLNLVPLQAKPGKAKWSGHFKPTEPAKPIPYLEALTWNPRRILLPAPEMGMCCYCGNDGVPAVGPGIVYLKNEDTKSNKKGGKTVPFEWRDPAAFYGDQDYKTVKSADEDAATDNRDLRWLAPSRSAVVTANPEHHGWLLVVPCTNPAHNKTFDHRLIEVGTLTSDAINGLVPAARRPDKLDGRDGWCVPKPNHPKGCAVFVKTAAVSLTHEDWGLLANAAYHDMQNSAAAFDVFAGLYWGLRGRNVRGLPSRNVAWLVLKLMAATPPRMRVLQPGATYNPLEDVPKRQTGGKCKFGYPVSFPRGQRLEAALRGQLHSNARRKHALPVDWAGLCNGLDQMLD